MKNLKISCERGRFRICNRQRSEIIEIPILIISFNSTRIFNSQGPRQNNMRNRNSENAQYEKFSTCQMKAKLFKLIYYLKIIFQTVWNVFTLTALNIVIKSIHVLCHQKNQLKIFLLHPLRVIQGWRGIFYSSHYSCAPVAKDEQLTQEKKWYCYSVITGESKKFLTITKL